MFLLSKTENQIKDTIPGISLQSSQDESNNKILPDPDHKSGDQNSSADHLMPNETKMQEFLF